MDRETSLYTWTLRHLALCSPAELYGLRRLAVRLMRMSMQARREGLLSLEEELASVEDSLLRLSLQLIIAGNEPEVVGSIIHIRIVMSGFRGASLRRALMIHEGILSIQQGDHPKIVREKLAGFLLPHWSSTNGLPGNDQVQAPNTHPLPPAEHEVDSPVRGLFSWSLRKSASCSADELNDLRPLADSLVEVARKVRAGQELELDRCEPLLRQGLQMLIDGFDVDTIAETMTNRIVVQGHKGAALRRDLLLSEGVVAIAKGLHPNIVREVLSTLLFSDSEEPAGGDSATQAARLQLSRRLKDLQEFEARSRYTALLEPIRNFGDAALLTILAKVDNEVLVRGLCGCGSGVIRVVVRNMPSSRLAARLMEDIEFMGPHLSDEDVHESQAVICNAVNELLAVGEIELEPDELVT